jgi:uncharacterized membrane protein
MAGIGQPRGADRAQGASPSGPEVWFDAVLHPHRSLSPLGFLILMIVLSAVSFATGVAFLMAGAWPVFGFFGLDVLLVYLAFRANFRSGLVYETLHLTRDELSVRRVMPSGESESWRFQPYWLRVEMDDPPSYDSQLRLSSHGKSLVIGAFLSIEEKLEVARALGEALARSRKPALA